MLLLSHCQEEFTTSPVHTSNDITQTESSSQIPFESSSALVSPSESSTGIIESSLEESSSEISSSSEPPVIDPPESSTQSSSSNEPLPFEDSSEQNSSDATLHFSIFNNNFNDGDANLTDSFLCSQGDIDITDGAISVSNTAGGCFKLEFTEPVKMSNFVNGSLEFDLKVSQTSEYAIVQIWCETGPVLVDLTKYARMNGNWETISIPFEDFPEINMFKISVPLTLLYLDNFLIDNIKYNTENNSTEYTSESSNDQNSGPGDDEFDIKVMSLNVKNIYEPADAINSWDNRKLIVRNMIAQLQLNIFGIQEAEIGIQDVDLAMGTSYNYFSIGEESNNLGKTNSIFYDKNLYEMDGDNSGAYWITYDDRGYTQGANFIGLDEEVITFVRLKHKESDQYLYVYNTNIYLGETWDIDYALETLAKFINERKYTDDPYIILGTFEQTEECIYDYLYDEVDGIDSYRVIKPEYYMDGTNHAFSGSLLAGGLKSDKIIVSENPEDVEVLSAEIVTYNEFNKFPSDHFPVISSLRFKVTD